MKVPYPIQPKDRNDEVYKLVAEYLQPGDQKLIALGLEVTPAAVSNIASGRYHSERIWGEIMQVVMKRKAEKIEWLNYMKKAS